MLEDCISRGQKEAAHFKNHDNIHNIHITSFANFKIIQVRGQDLFIL